MDYEKINIDYYIESVNIKHKDFDYISLCKSHSGIQINECLKDKELHIREKCDEISKLVYELREILPN